MRIVRNEEDFRLLGCAAASARSATTTGWTRRELDVVSLSVLAGGHFNVRGQTAHASPPEHCHHPNLADRNGVQLIGAVFGTRSRGEGSWAGWPSSALVRGRSCLASRNRVHRRAFDGFPIAIHDLARDGAHGLRRSGI